MKPATAALFAAAAGFAATPGGAAPISVATAQAGDPAAEVCVFAEKLGEGTDAIISQLQGMARLWNESDRAKLDPIMRPEIGPFKMVAGKVYSIGDLAPFAQEYLVVTAAPAKGQTIYFRVIYETGPNGYYFKNVKFNSDYYSILSHGILHEPREVNCAR
ncbi:MAG: hypothetical protein KDJ73_06570 [Notoacmeibacter sp.]|nr:hypothetical protein [Notoacmeibacter sp.]MCC0031616.1 hypothetical protein [Brucellaceae bacterium]